MINFKTLPVLFSHVFSLRKDTLLNLSSSEPQKMNSTHVFLTL